uniref:Uncharacterized protein n=1 Tax=Plectus sambesii TaxID=2011161 RepID=A0A914VBN2_9BILA
MKQPSSSAALSCQVCGSDSASVHFGSAVCLACAAFFRRTVQLSLEKSYTCTSDNSCDISQYARNVCRHCRMHKCLQIGMDRSAVQPKRNPIKKPTKLVTEAQSSPENICDKAVEGTSSENNVASFSAIFYASVRSQERPVLEDIAKAYRLLQEKRKAKYSSMNIPYKIDSKTGRKMLCDFDTAVVGKQIEIFFTGDFANSIKHFAEIPSGLDKFELFKQFMVIFESLDMCFRNLEPNWVETNIVHTMEDFWLDMKELPNIYATGVKTKVHFDPEECVRMFMPTIDQIKFELAQPMHDMKIRDQEMYALLGLALFDSNNNVSTETSVRCQDFRNRLFRELMDYCFEKDGPDGPARFGTIILLISACKRLRTASQEIYQMIKVFNMMDLDKMFLEICG